MEEDSQQVHRKGELSQGQDDKVPPPKKKSKARSSGQGHGPKRVSVVSDHEPSRRCLSSMREYMPSLCEVLG